MLKRLIAGGALLLAAAGGTYWMLRQPGELLSFCNATERCGYIDTAGNVVIAPAYTAAGDWAGDVGRVWRDTGVGSIDRSGHIVVAPQYRGFNFNAGGGHSVQIGEKMRLTDHALRPLNPELWDDIYGIKLNRRLRVEPEYLVLCRGGLCGLADGKGRIILAPTYEEISWRAHAFPLPFKERGLFGHLTESGQPISAERWDEAGLFHNKLANVTRGGKCGYIDPAGAVAIPLAFDECRQFWRPEAAIVRRGDTFALIDRAGRVLKDGFEEVAFGGENNDPVVRVQGKWGTVDLKGNFAIAPTFEELAPLDVFGPEREVPVGRVTLAYSAKVQGKVGLMALDGTWILPPLHDEIDIDYNGDGKIATYRDGERWGFVDLDTRKATAPLWHQIKARHRAALLPVRDGKKWGYADVDGKMHIPARYDQADELSGDWAWIQIGEKYGLIDKDGREIAPAVFRTVFDVLPERARVLLGNSRGWVNRDGRPMGISDDDLKRAGLKS